MRHHLICRYVFFVVAIVTMMVFAACTKPDRVEEAKKLRNEMRETLFKNPEQIMARIDSAEQVGVFSAAMTNLIRANAYGQMGQTRLAIYYGEQILSVPELKREGRIYYSALIKLSSLLVRKGEYGKVLRLSDEMIADVENDRESSGISEQEALCVKSHALTFKGECEKNLGNLDKAERFYLEGIDMMTDGVTHPTDFWVADALIYGVLETTEFYLGQGMPEKALALVAKGDTALARLDRSPDVIDYVRKMRHNNIIISQAIVYASNGQREQAEALYQKHRQAEVLTEADIEAEARYLALANRYDEAVRLFRRADSLYSAKGSAITSEYIKYYMMGQYEALRKAGRKDEALTLGDRIRWQTDSIHLQEQRADVEQEQEIEQKKSEIVSRQQSLVIHRIVLVASVLIILLIAYLLWRSYKYNKVLAAKNHSLYEQIQQRAQAEAVQRGQLQAQPEESLTAEQQLSTDASAC